MTATPPNTPKSTPHHIQFLLVDDMIATSATLPAEMLNSAQSFARANTHTPHQLVISTVGTTGKTVTTQSGFGLKPQTRIKKKTPSSSYPDIIYLPALWRSPRRIIQRNHDVLDWLRECYEAGSTIAGVGTGCCFIAAAGLLDNKPATTHWHYFDQFEQDYPKVKLKRDYFITQVEDIYCAASINSLADLTVHFIQQLYGITIAHHIERHFSHEIRRAYESMRYFEGSTDKHRDETILQTQVWLQDNFQHPIKLAELAQRFDMSVRSFNRRFKLATGKSPLNYLQELRMGNARDLLQTSNLSIGEVSYRVGYQDLGHFSMLFKKLYHASPHDYRTTVRPKLFSV